MYLVNICWVSEQHSSNATIPACKLVTCVLILSGVWLDSQLRLLGNSKTNTVWGFDCSSSLNVFVSPGYDVSGPVAIGLTHWKNPYAQGRPTLPSDLPLFVSKDAGIPVYHQSLTRKTDLATPLSCPASLSITPVPSYSSSSQETLSQDTTGNSAGVLLEIQDSMYLKVPSRICLLHLRSCLWCCGLQQFLHIHWPLMGWLYLKEGWMCLEISGLSVTAIW